MSLRFPSDAWAQAYGQAINQNAAYKRTAANWSDGAIALVCKADPSLGFTEPQGMVLDLERGSCKGVAYTTDPAEIAKTPFVIEASYAQWKSVIKGEIDPIKAMLQGHLRLTRGHLATVRAGVGCSRQLWRRAGAMATECAS